MDDAIKTAETALGASANSQQTTLEYLALSDSSVALTHVIRIQDDGQGIAVDAFVDAHANKLLSIVNYVNQLTVRASISSPIHILTLSTVPRPADPGGESHPGFPEPAGS